MSEHKIKLVKTLECARCGSLVSAGGRNVDPERDKFEWCPACAPGCAWRYGAVVRESERAKQLRSVDGELARCPRGCASEHEAVRINGVLLVGCPEHPKDAAPLFYDADLAEELRKS
jgi:hypothetical protein